MIQIAHSTMPSTRAARRPYHVLSLPDTGLPHSLWDIPFMEKADSIFPRTSMLAHLTAGMVYLAH